MTVRAGKNPVERDPPTLDHAGPFHPALAPVDRGPAGDLTATGRLGDTSVYGDVLQHQTNHPVISVQGDRLESFEDTQPDPLVPPVPNRRRRTTTVRDQLVRTHPNRSTCNNFSNTSRSAARGR